MIISVKHADITNSDTVILYDVNMDINEGDFIYITGKVGTGKTSLFNTFTAQTMPESGKVEVCGYDISSIRTNEIPFLRRKLGIVFQDLQLLKDRTVHDNLSFVLKATGWKKDEAIESRIDEVLAAVGMSTKAHRYPYQLSGGEQQRICIARAILNDPQIILADEPTGNLDEETAEGIMELFEKLNREHNTAIVMITHDKGIVDRHKGKVYVCDNESCTLCEGTRQGE